MAPLRLSLLIVVAFSAASCGEIDAPDPSAAAALPSSSAREFLEVGSADVGSFAPSDDRAGRTPTVSPGSRIGARATTDRIRIWTNPGDSSERVRMTIDAINPWGQRITFPVLRTATIEPHTWYKLQLGIEPNGSTGWVKSDQMVRRRLRERIVIDLSERRLRHYRGRRLLHDFDIGIGAPATPTTTGRFFVWAHLDPRDPTGPYGSYLLGLSGFSEVLTGWPGGGRMAIHGTADPTDPGRRVSFGCPRVLNPQMEQLRTVPMGTSVLIRR